MPFIIIVVNKTSGWPPSSFVFIHWGKGECKRARKCTKEQKEGPGCSIRLYLGSCSVIDSECEGECKEQIYHCESTSG